MGCGRGFPAPCRYLGSVGSSVSGYLAEADKLRNGTTVPIVLPNRRVDQIAAVLRLLLASTCVVDAVMEMHANNRPVAPPGGATELRMPAAGFGRNRPIDDLITTASGYRFIDTVTLLVLSKNGSSQRQIHHLGTKLGAGIFPDSNTGTHNGQVIDTNECIEGSGIQWHPNCFLFDVVNLQNRGNPAEQVHFKLADRQIERQRQG